jgi:hypothetical protein
MLQLQEQDGHDVLSHLNGDASTYGPPLAPGGLDDKETQATELLQLHKLIRQDGDTYLFKTFGALPLPKEALNRQYVFRPWWTLRAWKLVAEPSPSWQYSVYPADEGHAHCELTYVRIGAGEENKNGYVLGNTWVTREAYERFIRDDEYHCRHDV